MDALSRIEQIRKERNWSKKQLAEICGLGVSTVYNWNEENGNLPSAYAIKRICEGAKITLSEFYSSGELGEGALEQEIVFYEYWCKLTAEQRNAFLEVFKSIVS